MDKLNAFQKIIENKANCKATIKIKKVYINEDPNLEDKTLCPKCEQQNLENYVRYMYVNMNEAIYKCEGAACMFPFRDFKFKNYSDNTIYYYKPVINPAPPPKLMPREDDHSSSLVDFSFDLLSTEDQSLENIIFDNKPTRLDTSISALENDIFNDMDYNLFNTSIKQESRSSNEFDTGFIDDLLNDIGEAPVHVEDVKDIKLPENKIEDVNITQKKLKKCLKMFKETNISDDEPECIFKVPPLPGQANIAAAVSPSKLKKRHGKKKNRRPKNSNSIMEKNQRMKPLDLIHSINKLKLVKNEKASCSVNDTKTKVEKKSEPEDKETTADKVKKMLNFIERSMNFADKKPLPVQQTREEKARKVLKKESTVAKVIAKHDFEYETRREEEFGISKLKPGQYFNPSLPNLLDFNGLIPDLNAIVTTPQIPDETVNNSIEIKIQSAEINLDLSYNINSSQVETPKSPKGDNSQVVGDASSSFNPNPT